MTSSSPTSPTVGTAARASTSPGARVRRVLRRMAAFISVATLVVLADQWTKALIRARFEYGETWPAGWTLIRLTHVENTGAAFGILQGAGGALMVVTMVAIAGITFILFSLPTKSPLYMIALSAILGGAVGNLIDRVRIGAVTDFIEPWHYPAFNVADSAIVCGVATLLALTWFERDPREDGASGTAPGATSGVAS